MFIIIKFNITNVVLISGNYGINYGYKNKPFKRIKIRITNVILISGIYNTASRVHYFQRCNNYC